MFVVIVGCGRVGSQVGTLLSAEGHNVVIIDTDPGAFRRLGTVFNGVTIVGNGFDEDVLREAGIEQADAFAALTDLDNTNIMAAQVAKSIFKVPRVIARLYNPERAPTYQKMGLEVICGTTIVANRIRNKILQSHFTSHLTLGRNEVEVVEFRAGENIAGRSVREIEIPGELKVSSLLRNGTVIIPREDTTIEASDLLVAAVKVSSLEKARQRLGLGTEVLY
jgi:trk system potassium uptake protein TrkA